MLSRPVRYIGVKGGLRLIDHDHPERARRARYYNATILSWRRTEFNKYGSLNLKIRVGTHIVYIEYLNFKPQLDYAFKRFKKDLYKAVDYVINWMMKKGSIRFGCTCPDFTYRFKYLVTKRGLLAHNLKPERRPSRITNPNEEGLACKHVYACWKNSRMILEQAIDVIMDKYLIDKYYPDEEGFDDGK